MVHNSLHLYIGYSYDYVVGELDRLCEEYDFSFIGGEALYVTFMQLYSTTAQMREREFSRNTLFRARLR